jgi:hypothetical protein
MQRPTIEMNPAAPFGPRPMFSEFYPLNEFYAARNTPMPAIGEIHVNDIPGPYR